MLSQRQLLISQYELSKKHISGLKKLIDDLCAKPESDANSKLITQCLNGEYSAIKALFSDPRTLLSAALTQAGYIDLSKKAASGAYDHDRVPVKKHNSEQPEPSPESARSSSESSNEIVFFKQNETKKVEKKESTLRNLFSPKR